MDDLVRAGKILYWGVSEWNADQIASAVNLARARGWAEPVEFMYHCSTKWAVFLLSLKQLLETGHGAPDPDDVKISDWH